MGFEAVFKQQKAPDVFCPHCGTKAPLFLYKPACPNCHWNVRAAKANVIRQLRNAIVPVLLFIALAYFVNAEKSKSSVLFYLWPMAFGSFMFGREYFRLVRLGEQRTPDPLVLPPSIFPQMPTLEPAHYNHTFLLSLLIEALVVAISGWIGYSSLPQIIEGIKKRQVDIQTC